MDAGEEAVHFVIRIKAESIDRIVSEDIIIDPHAQTIDEIGWVVDVEDFIIKPVDWDITAAQIILDDRRDVGLNSELPSALCPFCV